MNERAVMMRKISGYAMLLGSLAFLAARPEFSTAQDVPAGPPASSTQPTSDVVSSGAPVVLPSTQPATNLLMFNSRTHSIDAVLDYLSQTADFTVIKIKPATGRITMFTLSPVTPEAGGCVSQQRAQKRWPDGDPDGQAAQDHQPGRCQACRHSRSFRRRSVEDREYR